MHAVRGTPILVSAALCAVLAGCASAPSFAALNACRDLREASSDFRDSNIDIAEYVGLLQAVARGAQDADERSLVTAGASLKDAVGVAFSSIIPLGDVTTMTRAADDVGNACDELGL